MFYHPFKKTVKSKSGKITKRWYYWWIDPITNIQHQKIMSGITNQVDAYSYVSKLEQPTEQKKHITIKEITKDMFLPNSEHIERLNMLGKKLSPRTMMTYRRITNLITERYGHINLEDLTIPMVNGYLMSLTESTTVEIYIRCKTCVFRIH